MGKTILIFKKKPTIANDYRAITCLKFLWNFWTGQILKEVYSNLESQWLSLEEQKESKKKAAHWIQQVFGKWNNMWPFWLKVVYLL